MKKSELARVAPVMFGRLLSLLGKDRWKVELVVGPCSSTGAFAEIMVLGEYRSCSVTVDDRIIRDRSHLLQILAHEALHVGLSGLERFSDSMIAYMGEDGPGVRLLNSVLVQGIEEAVTTLEDLLVFNYREKHGA